MRVLSESRPRSSDRGIDFQRINPLETLIVGDPYTGKLCDPAGPPPFPRLDYAEMRDAAMECKHGRLPFDGIERTDPCGCWARIAATQLPVPLAPEPRRTPVPPRRPRSAVSKWTDEQLALRLLARRIYRAGEAVAAARHAALALPAPTKGEAMPTTNESPTATEVGQRERMLNVCRVAVEAGDSGFARIDVEKLLGLNDTQAQYLLRKMADEGQIEMRGTTFSRRYYANGHAPPDGEDPAPEPPSLTEKPRPKRTAAPAKAKRSKFDPALKALREEAQQVQAEMERLAERQRMLREAIVTLEQLDGDGK